MNPKQEQNDQAFTGAKLLIGTFCFVVVCATFYYLASQFDRHPEPPRRLWSPIIVGTNGEATILGESRRMEFWTPSVNTKEYLHTEHGKIVATELWQVMTNDDALLRFGAALRSNPSVLGYRREEVWGQGRTLFKPGWWWTVNVMTNYTPEEMGRTYQGFWKCGQSVFIEVIDNRGRKE